MEHIVTAQGMPEGAESARRSPQGDVDIDCRWPSPVMPFEIRCIGSLVLRRPREVLPNFDPRVNQRRRHFPSAVKTRYLPRGTATDTRPCGKTVAALTSAPTMSEYSPV